MRIGFTSIKFTSIGFWFRVLLLTTYVGILCYFSILYLLIAHNKPNRIVFSNIYDRSRLRWCQPDFFKDVEGNYFVVDEHLNSVLILTSDCPLVEGDAIDSFICRVDLDSIKLYNTELEHDPFKFVVSELTVYIIDHDLRVTITQLKGSSTLNEIAKHRSNTGYHRLGTNILELLSVQGIAADTPHGD